MKKLLSFTQASSISLTDDWAHLPFQGDGSIVIENNKWGISGGNVRGDKYTQSITPNGWSWEVSDTKVSSIAGYPEAIVGIKPWTSGQKPTEIWPIPVASLGSLSFDISFKVEAIGSYNTAAEWWYLKSPEMAPQNIVAEVMVWFNKSELDPFGEHAGACCIAGTEYDIYVGTVTHSAEVPGGWALISLVCKSPVYEGKVRVPVGEITEALFSKRILNPETAQFLPGFEFGNEVKTSQGNTTLHELSMSTPPAKQSKAKFRS